MTELAVRGLPHQEQFWADQTSRELAMIGPLGCGKTYGLAVKQLLLRLANAKCDGLLLVPTHGMAERIHKREWPAIWESLGFPVEVQHQRGCFRWPWGTFTWLMSAEEPDRMKGVNVGDAMVDEPGQISREAYDVACSRIRHPLSAVKQMALAGTPEGINWLADLFGDPDPQSGRRTIWSRHWHASLADYPEKLKATYGYDRALFDTYARGAFVPLRQGRAYNQFSRATHVCELIHERRLPMVLACDFNVDAMRWEVLQLLPGEIRVIDEIALGQGGSTQEAAREFVRRYQGQCFDLTVTGDAAGQARSTSGSTDYAVLREELRPHFPAVRFNVPAANPRVHERVQLVNYHLAGRSRKTYIDPKCRELILDLERVAWRPGTTEIDKAADLLRTHASDALGYALWQLAPTLAACRPEVPEPAFRDPDPILEAAF